MPTTGNREEGAAAACSATSDAAAREGVDAVRRLDPLRARRPLLEGLLMKASSSAFR
jgi:hypothetical protein